MDSYQQYIHMSRYSRWREDLGRRETWPETVQRYVDFFDKRTDYQFTDTLQGEVKQGILNMDVMPSMRALMTAGEALERENLAGYNCFAGHVQYMTENGLVSFNQTVNTVQRVLAGDGQWREAAVRSFGKQKVQRVTLRPGSRSRTDLRLEFDVTPDHRWITGRGEVTDLKVGDTIPFNQVAAPDFNPVDFIAGFGFGDGTLDQRGRARIRLCGAKAKFLQLFEDYGNCAVMYPPSSQGDPVIVFHKGHFVDWKTLPKAPGYWWLRGYLAADGHANELQPGLSTQDAEAATYVARYAPFSGLALTGWNVLCGNTNYGPRANPLIRLGLREDIDFRVVAIEPLGEEEVFCVTEPVTGQFTLEGGVLTGNCSYLAVNSKRAFAETLYILLCGTGAGFSCERQEIAKLPPVPEEINATDDTIVVADSKEGWAKAYYSLLNHLWVGDNPIVDYSKVRPAGARLKIFGGRASGPEPLKRLFQFTVETFKKARGRKLTSIEVHDLMCMIGEIVVVGGVRRSALISLSNLSDQRMRDAKSGQWWVDNAQRALANNSVAYTEKPSAEIFMEEWLALVRSKSGERGIFNREAAQKQASKWGRRKADLNYGCNPCSEIILRDKQLCNLSEVIIREHDTEEDLLRKVRLATILGTLQATLTDFKFVSETWARNTAEEALLGVSLTGIMDNPLTAGSKGYDVLAKTLNRMRDHAREVNTTWSKLLGINVSTAITCVKPSGTVSQLCNTASGIHPRYNRNYIRTVRVDKKDPLYHFMVAKGFPIEDDVMRPDSTAVVSFAMSAPDSAITTDQVSAIQALEHWLLYQREWCEHKPSVTINVGEDEWVDVGAWVYRHFDEISGVSFLPRTEHTYQQAPYQNLTQSEFDAWIKEHPLPHIDWSELAQFEKTDNTVAMQTLACVAGACELPNV